MVNINISFTLCYFDMFLSKLYKLTAVLFAHCYLALPLAICYATLSTSNLSSSLAQFTNLNDQPNRTHIKSLLTLVPMTFNSDSSANLVPLFRSKSSRPWNSSHWKVQSLII